MFHTHIDFDKLSRENVSEACTVKIIINNTKLCILCLYRAQDGEISQFIEQFDCTLSYLVSNKMQTIICGDTNINYFDENQKRMQLQSLLDTYNQAQTIDFPTRIGPNSALLIDNFFLDRNAYNNFQVLLVLNGLSDHNGKILVPDNLQAMRQLTVLELLG
jgi:hypothetical protein